MAAASKVAQVIELLVKIAKKEVGTEEVPRGSNSGKRVQEYQDADTLGGTGYYWCASFVVWVCKLVCAFFNCRLPFPASASCDDILRHGREKKLIYSTPQVGDIFFVVPDPDKPWDATHMGLVTEAEGRNWRSAEGNSNSDGSRNGYEVASNPKVVASRFKFYRWVKELGNLELNPTNEATVFLSGRNLGSFPIMGKDIIFPVKDFFKFLGKSIDTLKFDPETRALSLDGKIITGVVTLKDGHSHMPLAKLVAFISGYPGSKLNLAVSGDGRKATITRAKK